jgi:hypothetical protein
LILTHLPDFDFDINGQLGVNEFIYHNNDASSDGSAEADNVLNKKTYLRFNQAEVQIKAGDHQALWLKKNIAAPHVISIGGTEKTLVKDVSLDVSINSIIFLHPVTVGNLLLL